MCVYVRVCVCARARTRVYICECVCVREREREKAEGGGEGVELGVGTERIWPESMWEGYWCSEFLTVEMNSNSWHTGSSFCQMIYTVIHGQ